MVESLKKCPKTIKYEFSDRMWWIIRDSNPGPTGYEPVALTN